MMHFGYGRRDIPEAQRHANLDTVRRVRETVSEMVGAERRRQAEGPAVSWRPEHCGPDEAALGIPPHLDEEGGADGA
ncbi:hypothetical protein ABZU32_26375 [Sphaerisporangium sp. NPDC005288]|uniref:hypothetical protein n=1 Tax=Sphaerisporangium sp. NPDC005288 TaxID=3155114 RepID=UPI0033B23DDB